MNYHCVCKEGTVSRCQQSLLNHDSQEQNVYKECTSRKGDPKMRLVTSQVGSVLENLQFGRYYFSFLFSTSTILIYLKNNH